MKSIKVSVKPRKCQHCGKNSVVKILYGEPTEEAREVAQNCKLIIGGCIIDEKSAT